MNNSTLAGILFVLPLLVLVFWRTFDGDAKYYGEIETKRYNIRVVIYLLLIFGLIAGGIIAQICWLKSS